MTTLADTLAARKDQEAMKPNRELVDLIIVYPRQARDPIRFDIRGRLAALLNSEVGMPVPRGRNNHTHIPGIEPIFLIRCMA